MPPRKHQKDRFLPQKKTPDCPLLRGDIARQPLMERVKVVVGAVFKVPGAISTELT